MDASSLTCLWFPHARSGTEAYTASYMKPLFPEMGPFGDLKSHVR